MSKLMDYIERIVRRYRVRASDYIRVKKHERKVKKGLAAPSVSLKIDKTTHNHRYRVNNDHKRREQ